jgi:hypothetical protein
MDGGELARKAAKWDWIAAAWEKYLTEGAGAFDWDYDSRDLMRMLSADEPSAAIDAWLRDLHDYG